ncbi:sorting nexin-29 [Mytilus galloprovincialis]|uniref:Sorting nexin-29 n=1 Tax=Mytilus galloprovincialis TaxID=29158 RepID=A0A8B6HS30_MYTGA|nr:sorting nexin-29 [Mytilus galloprovincialis]
MFIIKIHNFFIIFTGDEQHVSERQNLLTRLLDAVKQCQVRFGGRTELAADADSRVSCLCAAWEAVLQHGLKQTSKAFQALKQVTEITGLNKVSDVIADITSKEIEPEYWLYVKEHLTKHEQDRFFTLKHINTDAGRGRAWLRASLNEHSLERYMHMLLERDELLSNHYETWAFLRDQERNSMLPNMAAGLGSILFAINVDNSDLNTVRRPTTAVNIPNTAKLVGRLEEEPRPVIAGEESPPGSGSYDSKKKEKKKKKKNTHIVSFEDGTSQTLFHHVNSSDQYSTQQTEQIPDISISDTSPVENILRSEYSLHREPSIVSNTSLDQASVSSADFDVSESTMRPVDFSGDPIDFGISSFRAESSSILGSSVSSSEHGGIDVQSAAFALDMVQRGMDNSYRTAGDGGNDKENIRKDAMSTNELKQAVVAMMVRKDEVEEQNRNLQMMLEQEMETSSTLRAEIEDMKVQSSSKQEKEITKYQSLQKENELLKNQLRRYVNAVQMLRAEGSQDESLQLGVPVEEPQPNIPPAKSNIDYSHEASEYEQKLIQVAEMHGELMEFNEMLHRQLNHKEAYIRRLQQELIDLRGPLPRDLHMHGDQISGNSDSHSVQSKSLINIWIPSAFIRGGPRDNYHVYQVYVRIKDEEWNVYKRYSQFRDLHLHLRKKYPIVNKYEFPPKKTIGKKDAKVVEGRRKMFQSYLRSVVNYLSENDPGLADSICKIKLSVFLPFFSDKPIEKGDKKKIKKTVSSASLPGSVPEPIRETMQNQYDGL